VQILDEDQQRTSGRLRLPHTEQEVESVLFLPLGGHRCEQRGRIRRNREQHREERQVLDPVDLRPQPRLQLVELRRCRIFGADPGGELDVCDHRVQGAVHVVRRALEAQGHARVPEALA
jgi:hypothetical protein